MRRLRHLTDRHRAPSADRALGLLLAFNAGAVNAGGYLVLRQYTSHMTGFASQFADALVLGHTPLLLAALGAVLAFVCGAAVAAQQIEWGCRHRMRHPYALPLLLEAALLLPFGLAGAITLAWHTPFAVPLTVLLLAFTMGLQNALASATTAGRVRTTHMTGNLTDFGLALGRALYAGPHAFAERRHDAARLATAGALVAMFVAGGVAGAAGFKAIGFICVLPLAALLLWLSLPPLFEDLRRARALPAAGG